MTERSSNNLLTYRAFIRNFYFAFMRAESLEDFARLEQQLIHLWEQARPIFTQKKSCILIFDEIKFNRGSEIGVGLITCAYFDTRRREAIPIAGRLFYSTDTAQQKHTSFNELLDSIHFSDVKPYVVILDSWYASLRNLKLLRTLNWHWIAFLKNNRVINRNQMLKKVEVPRSGMMVHLRGYGWISIFSFMNQNGLMKYVGTDLTHITDRDILYYMKIRWQLKQFHRVSRKGTNNLMYRSYVKNDGDDDDDSSSNGKESKKNISIMS